MDSSDLDPHLSQPPKRYLHWFNRFCRAHERDQQTDTQTDKQTDHATEFVAIARMLCDACNAAQTSLTDSNVAKYLLIGL